MVEKMLKNIWKVVEKAALRRVRGLATAIKIVDRRGCEKIKSRGLIIKTTGRSLRSLPRTPGPSP